LHQFKNLSHSGSHTIQFSFASRAHSTDYDPPARVHSSGLPLGIGPGCQIEGAILDKNVSLGEGVIIHPFPRGTELDRGHFTVHDGIVVVPKDTVLPSGTRIEP
jgi:ADP-glucose pyrophosphorylase